MRASKLHPNATIVRDPRQGFNIVVLPLPSGRVLRVSECGYALCGGMSPEAIDAEVAEIASGEFDAMDLENRVLEEGHDPEDEAFMASLSEYIMAVVIAATESKAVA